MKMQAQRTWNLAHAHFYPPQNKRAFTDDTWEMRRDSNQETKHTDSLLSLSLQFITKSHCDFFCFVLLMNWYRKALAPLMALLYSDFPTNTSLTEGQLSWFQFRSTTTRSLFKTNLCPSWQARVNFQRVVMQCSKLPKTYSFNRWRGVYVHTRIKKKKRAVPASSLLSSRCIAFAKRLSAELLSFQYRWLKMSDASTRLSWLQI